MLPLWGVHLDDGAEDDWVAEWVTKWLSYHRNIRIANVMRPESRVAQNETLGAAGEEMTIPAEILS